MVPVSGWTALREGRIIEEGDIVGDIVGKGH
jgi:hypothetical protein